MLKWRNFEVLSFLPVIEWSTRCFVQLKVVFEATCDILNGTINDLKHRKQMASRIETGRAFNAKSDQIRYFRPTSFLLLLPLFLLLRKIFRKYLENFQQLFPWPITRVCVTSKRNTLHMFLERYEYLYLTARCFCWIAINIQACNLSNSEKRLNDEWDRTAWLKINTVYYYTFLS